MTADLIEMRRADVAESHRERQREVPAETRSPREGGRDVRPVPNIDQILDDSFPASDPPSWTGSISRVA